MVLNAVSVTVGGVVVTRDSLLVVVQKGDASLGFFDPMEGQERHRIELDPFPHEFVVSADQRYAYIAHFGLALAEDQGQGGNLVSVVDLNRRQRLRSFDCGQYRRPHGITLDGHNRLYVLSEGTNRLLVATRPDTREFDRVLPTAGEGSHIVTSKRDGSIAFCSNMISNTVSAVFPLQPDRDPVVLPVGTRPEGSVLDSAEQILYVSNRESAEISRIHVPTLNLLEPIRTRPGPVRVCWDHHGRLLVPLYHDASLAIVDPCTADAQIHVELPAKPISVSFDASMGWALTSTLNNEVCIIDVARREVVRQIKTRDDPDPTALLWV
jgi:DNA-binding beta-propeller fold protein YncE